MTDKLKVLLVDDDPSLRKIGQISLEKGAGWEVITCASGSEAIGEAQKRQPDVILLDIMMPGMDGITAYKRLKEIVPSIPVIFMTAKAQSHELASYMELGITGVISKPFDPLKLPESVRNILKATSNGPDQSK